MRATAGSCREIHTCTGSKIRKHHVGVSMVGSRQKRRHVFLSRRHVPGTEFCRETHFVLGILLVYATIAMRSRQIVLGTMHGSGKNGRGRGGSRYSPTGAAAVCPVGVRWPFSTNWGRISMQGATTACVAHARLGTSNAEQKPSVGCLVFLLIEEEKRRAVRRQIHGNKHKPRRGHRKSKTHFIFYRSCQKHMPHIVVPAAKKKRQQKIKKNKKKRVEEKKTPPLTHTDLLALHGVRN